MAFFFFKLVKGRFLFYFIIIKFIADMITAIEHYLYRKCLRRG
jgi:hypothetical protein